MGEIRIRKFALDYLVGAVLAFLFLILLVGGFDLVDEKIVFDTSRKCSQSFSNSDIFRGLESPLDAEESCSVSSPCDQWHKVECMGTLRGSEIPGAILFQQFLFSKVNPAVVETDWFGGGYKLQYAPKFSTATFLLITIYCGILIEASALIFALWRQRSLGEMFYLPFGSRYQQFLGPFLFAVILAATMAGINYHLFQLFDYPGTQVSYTKQSFFRSVPGIAFAVLLAPVLEEMLFRGVFLKYFVGKNRAILGAILVSLGFATLHIFKEQTFAWALYTLLLYFAVSLAISWIYIKQQNLWSAIVFHSGFNSTMVAISLVFY